MSIAHAYACSPNQRAENKIQSLPKEVIKTIPAGMGVDLVTRVYVPDAHVTLFAAVATPDWYFTICDGGKGPENDDGDRVLLVWREEGGRWIEVGRNAKLLYPVATAGWAFIEISATRNGIYLMQFSDPPPRAHFHDYYTFDYDNGHGRMRLTRRESESVYYPMAGIGVGYEDYERAVKKYGENVCEREGFSGEADYMTGKGIIVMCEFALPEKVLKVQEELPVLYLEDVAETPFDKLYSFK